MEKLSAKTLEIIVKITERCNINCSYCYMFNLGNQDYEDHDAVMKTDTADALVKFIEKGVANLSTEHLFVVFHGGEPLLMKKDKFAELCDKFQRAFSGRLKTLQLYIQTNAMLVDDEWISIFERYKVHIGVSIDGPKHLHDEVRIDHKGKGTYDRTIVGLRRLQQAARDGRIDDPGALVVIDPKQDSLEIFRHVYFDLGFPRANFLLPMLSRDTASANVATDLQRYLLGLADEYLSVDDATKSVRIVDYFLKFLTNGAPFKRSSEPFTIDYGVCSISSSGDLSPDDQLKSLNIYPRNATIYNTTLREYFNSPELRYFYDLEAVVPTDCRDCIWKNYCKGGAGVYSLISRFDTARGFDNKSIFCDALKPFFAMLAKHFGQHGLAMSAMAEALDFTDTTFHSPIPRPPASVRRTIPIVAN
jgi:uncharacterized protein